MRQLWAAKWCADACGKFPSVFETLARLSQSALGAAEYGQKQQHNSVREPSDPSSSNSGLDVSQRQKIFAADAAAFDVKRCQIRICRRGARDARAPARDDAHRRPPPAATQNRQPPQVSPPWRANSG